MRKGHTQESALLTVQTALGKDVLLLDSVQGQEGISELYCFALRMRSPFSDLDAKQVLGKAASITMKIGDDIERELHGIISRFSYLGSDADFAHYSAELVPAMWLMTLGRDRVIYQNQSTPEIVKSVLQQYQIRCEEELSATYAKREYCVRYDETAFAFVSRLLEEEGICYFFKHQGGTTHLVLADSNTAFTACPNVDALTVHSGLQDGAGLRGVSQFEQASQVTVKTQSVDDFNFLSPSTDLLSKQEAMLGFGSDYFYGAGHVSTPDGAARAKLYLEAQHQGAVRGLGKSWCSHLTAGVRFSLQSHARKDLNAEHVLRRVHHHADSTGYFNEFETFSPQSSYRPEHRTSRPLAQGSHTAKVVGPSGEEIWTDQYGRVKVQFPWDRVGKGDDKSSCWIRLSHMWAGQGWGTLFVPRIGQEVIVTYLDANPDRPLITGCVYNAEHATPVNLPGQSTQSAIRSSSSKGGSAGNELRFEDKKDAEELYLHAQKDMRTEVENDLSMTVIKGNETHTVKQGSRSIAVEKGDETHKVEGRRSLSVTGDESHANAANFTQEVKGQHTLKVQGDLLIDVTGSITIKSAQAVNIQAGTELVSKAGTNLTNEAGVSLKNKAGVALSNEAVKIDSKASGLHGVEAGGVLSLKGSLVKIN